jgi:hypothetical protein
MTGASISWGSRQNRNVPFQFFTSPTGPPCDTRTPRILHLSAKTARQRHHPLPPRLPYRHTTPTPTPTYSDRDTSIRPSNPFPIPTPGISPRHIYQLGAPPHMGHQAIQPPLRKCSGRRAPSSSIEWKLRSSCEGCSGLFIRVEWQIVRRAQGGAKRSEASSENGLDTVHESFELLATSIDEPSLRD